MFAVFLWAGYLFSALINSTYRLSLRLHEFGLSSDEIERLANTRGPLPREHFELDGNGRVHIALPKPFGHWRF
jgi:hypothetical protein